MWHVTRPAGQEPPAGVEVGVLKTSCSDCDRSLRVWVHVQIRQQFLVCNHVTRRPCWGSKEKNISSKNLHENRVYFPEERNAFVLDHQHGCREVTCKPAIASCRNMLRRHLAATNRFECTGEILWKSLSLQQNFVAATSHTKFCLIWFFATCCCDKILLQKIQKFSTTHEPICHCDVSCCSNLSPSVYRP